MGWAQPAGRRAPDRTVVIARLAVRTEKSVTRAHNSQNTATVVVTIVATAAVENRNGAKGIKGTQAN